MITKKTWEKSTGMFDVLKKHNPPIYFFLFLHPAQNEKTRVGKFRQTS